MKQLIDIINEKLRISSKTKNDSPYFSEDTMDDYAHAVDEAIAKYGYKAINKNNRAIWVFPKNIQARSMGLKNLICSIYSKKYIEWGPNENLKDKLEEPILNAINSVD